MKRVQNKMWWYNTSTIQTSGSVINTVSSVSDRLVNKIVKKKKYRQVESFSIIRLVKNSSGKFCGS